MTILIHGLWYGSLLPSVAGVSPIQLIPVTVAFCDTDLQVVFFQTINMSVSFKCCVCSSSVPPYYMFNHYDHGEEDKKDCNVTTVAKYASIKVEKNWILGNSKFQEHFFSHT